MRRSVIVLLPFALACGPSVPVASDGTTSGADDDVGSAGPRPTSDPDPSTTHAATTTSASSSADGSSSNGGDVSTSVDDDDGGFLDIDGGGPAIECDLWIDDCPPGQKCMPWAYDGGNVWNSTKCSPLAENPNQVGDPCMVEGRGFSGVDDCEAHAMCWQVNPETNVGTCVGFCTGSEANPTCPDPCGHCAVLNEGVLILCLSTCDPLAQNCPEQYACFPSGDSFACNVCCAGESGQLGDGCEFLNVCDPGLFCADADRFPGCQSDFGCCTPFCDALAEDPCPASPAGLECIPWFDEGEAPPCFAQVVGGCLLPE